MGLLAWIVLGGIAGFLANYIIRGGFGLIPSLIMGIIGAVIAGWVSNYLQGTPDAFELGFVSIVMSTFFALLVVFGAKILVGRSGGDG